jgi:probable LLM family oxidoreductase
MDLGIYTFGDFGKDPKTGNEISAHERIRSLIEEVELADQLGLDVFGLGEHHRAEFAVSAPPVVLAAAAERSQSIRLTSAVTVLSSDDPVRVWEQYATLDLISNGRAEIMAGRGSFTESFPLFGFDLEDYDELFAEKLELLLALRDAGDKPVSWSGRLRPPLDEVVLVPQPLQNPLPVWIAVGGNPESVIRAGTLGLPMMIAIIGGMPERFAPLVEMHREAAISAGHDEADLKVGIASIGWVGEDLERAKSRFYPGYAALMTQIGKERGWGPMSPRAFEAMITPRGALMLGTPEQVAEKILFQHEIFSHDRFTIQMGSGAVSHAEMMKTIELFGSKVAPLVRDEIGRRAKAA